MWEKNTQNTNGISKVGIKNNGRGGSQGDAYAIKTSLVATQ